jgi:hypothetical protein
MASKNIHSHISKVLDLYHFYTSSFLQLQQLSLPGFEKLHRELGQDHCQQVQDWVRFLHINNMEVSMENIFIGNKNVSYYQKLEDDKRQKDLPEFLMDMTNDAINKEESLQESFEDEETVFVHLRDQEILDIRLGSLEFCKEMLEDVKEKTMELEEMDKVVKNLEIRGALE